MKKFANTLIRWYLQNKRELPWRETSDPYLIWLSEVILQQTRVEQGLPYYQRFIRQYPTVQKLAKAEEEEVLKLWQGLGYYSRARNMLHTAKAIVDSGVKKFPSSYEELIAFKGIGPYTASAVSSFAANEVRPVLDGNVYRLVSRLTGNDTPVPGNAAQKEFQAILAKWIDLEKAGVFNQAMMEFGSQHCVPRNPSCENCVFRGDCVAYKQGLVADLPVKASKTAVLNKYLYYAVLSDGNRIWLRKRSGAGIWKGLYDFPLVESDNALSAKQIEKDYLQLLGITALPRVKYVSDTFKHLLSHRRLHIQFCFFPVKKNFSLKENADICEVPLEKLEQFPVPIVIHRYLKQEGWLKVAE